MDALALGADVIDVLGQGGERVRRQGRPPGLSRVGETGLGQGFGQVVGRMNDPIDGGAGFGQAGAHQLGVVGRCQERPMVLDDGGILAGRLRAAVAVGIQGGLLGLQPRSPLCQDRAIGLQGVAHGGRLISEAGETLRHVGGGACGLGQGGQALGGLSQGGVEFGQETGS